MFKRSQQGNLVLITNKNGRLDFELNQATQTRSEGIVIGDLYGYISDVNDALLKIMGAHDKSEFIGRNILEFLAKEEKARAIQSALDAIANDQGMTQRFRICLQNGKETTLEVSTTFLKDDEGNSIGFIHLVRAV
ncbi:MAG: PAS domain-containing protein [Candidatus Bathyarchaeota archaeon]|nr:PAS domain-containing protein [Candidatus Bathyarchaeota archaeon]